MGSECGKTEAPQVRFLDEVQARLQMVIDRLQDTNNDLARTLAGILGDTLADECPTPECYRDPSVHCSGTYTSNACDAPTKAPAVSRIMHVIELLEVIATQLEKNARRTNQI